MEMYVGSVERIAYYAETSLQEKLQDDDDADGDTTQELQEIATDAELKEKKEKTRKLGQQSKKDDENNHVKHNDNDIDDDDDDNIKGHNNACNNNRKVSFEQVIGHFDGSETKFSTRADDNNDKLLNLAQQQQHRRTPTDNNVNRMIAAGTWPTTPSADDDKDDDYAAHNDGQIAEVTAKTFATTVGQKTELPTTTASEATIGEDNITNNKKMTASTTSDATASTATGVEKKTLKTNAYTKPLERNDVERRRASVRRSAKCKKLCKYKQ